MSAKLDDELRAAFEVASEFIEPPDGLADKARRARRTWRHRRRDAVAACAVVIATAGAVYALAGHYNSTPVPEPPGPRVVVQTLYPVSEAAVSGQYLYLASSQRSLVVAYSRFTGELVRRFRVHGSPTWLAIGPGRLVWVGIVGDRRPNLMTLLSPDLRRHATAGSPGPGPLVPTSRQTALTAAPYGVVEVHMLAPGQPGVASLRQERDSRLGAGLTTAPGNWAGLLDGRVAVQVTNGYGYGSHLVIAGEPGVTFGGDPQQQVGAVAKAGDSLWVQTFAINNSRVALSGPLVRLDGQLRATTPASILSNPVLARSKNVWSAGSAVWVFTGAPGHALVCFATRSAAGPVITVRASGTVAAVVATPGTVYVTTLTGVARGRSVVTSYPIPAGCQ
jgi:hypothetical protein